MQQHNANEPEGPVPFGLTAINSLTLLADFSTDVITGLCRHGHKTVAFAGSMTFAGVLGGFTVVMTFAFVDVIAMYIGIPP
jgi:hypothetical protein